MDSTTVTATATTENTELSFNEIHDIILENTLNKCPTHYSSLQINYYKEINKIAALMSEQFIERRLDISDLDDKTINEFFIRTLVIMLIHREISVKPINVILSNFGGKHKAIIVNTEEFKAGYKLTEGQKRDNFQYETLLGPVRFDVGYFENRKLNSQIVFRHELALKFAKNNIMLNRVLMTRLNTDETLIEKQELLECREYLDTMEEVLVDESEPFYKELEKIVSARIQAQYTMLQIIASIIIVHQKMI